ncbi:MAG: Nramp family divalent metal transporter [Fuerstiella sp.]|nr:Nramp family divalent metal transporter [Fuerstiella sp.]
MADQITSRRWYRRIGPGLITACVVIGPGSIMTSSKIGANEQYSMLWVVVVSVAFMMLFMTLGAKLGVAATGSPCDHVRKKAGNWLAVLVGTGIFFISAAFQSGNNIGVAAAFETFIHSKPILTGLIVVFNLLTISFLFVFKDLYRLLEKTMAFFVALMLICFAINLIRLRPDLAAMGKGLIPSLDRSVDTMTVLGLIGTTFAIAAAFFQAYLVRQKGWNLADLRSGLVDARVGSFVMFLITLILMSTAAAGLYTGKSVQLNNPVSVATSLETTFGPTARTIFCVGLFCAAYSSFLVNSMIGGFMASDGLGLGSNPEDTGPKIMTTAVLLTGLFVGFAVLMFDFDRTPTIIAAQAVTVVAAPLVAGVLLWLTSSRDIMGEQVNHPVTIGFGLIGILMLFVMAGKTALVDIPLKLNAYQQLSESNPTVD